MVGIRSFPIGFRPIFRGELLVSGEGKRFNYSARRLSSSSVLEESIFNILTLLISTVVGSWSLEGGSYYAGKSDRLLTTCGNKKLSLEECSWCV